MKSFFPEEIKRIHLIGIGGISMSALAKILQNNGYLVSGSDMQYSPEVDELKHKNIPISLGHDTSFMKDAQMVIFSSAIHEDNPEIVYARQHAIPMMERSRFLGILTKQFEHSISIAGTHGKTTTTSMLGVMLAASSVDPVVLVGAHVKELGGNTRIGHGHVILNEACEYHRSFLDFHTTIAVILNIEADHLDYFTGGLEEIKQAFLTFANSTDENGLVILNADDENTMSLRPLIERPVMTYGIEHTADMMAKDIRIEKDGCPSFDVWMHGIFLYSVHLSVPGLHNVSNALAALLSAEQVMDVKDELKALEAYSGASRRMELKGSYHGAKLMEDYAHHPTEIRTTIKALRQMYPNQKLHIVFQPHTYTRTLLLFEEFRDCFLEADQVDLVDIYAARESDIYGINSEMLSQKIAESGTKVRYLGSLAQAAPVLKKELQTGTLLVVMGAGDIYHILEELKD